MFSRKKLEIALSRVRGFSAPVRRLEQYVSDASSAAMMVHEAFIRGDVEGRVIADLGAGTGIIGIGAALLGAEKVYMIEVERAALSVLMENVKSFCVTDRIEVVGCDVREFNIRVNTVLMNPPFGKFLPGGDRLFLERAMQIADAVYTFTNYRSNPFVRNVARSEGFTVEFEGEWEVEIRMSYAHHKKESFRQKVDFYVLRRK